MPITTVRIRSVYSRTGTLAHTAGSLVNRCHQKAVWKKNGRSSLGGAMSNGYTAVSRSSETALPAAR